MHNLTFEQLPQAVSHLTNEVSEIKRLILEKSKDNQPDPDRWFSLTELCNYLPDKPAKATVYSWVHNGVLPHHKGAKKLRFLKAEIDLWLKEGKQKTLADVSSEAKAYLNKKKGR